MLLFATQFVQDKYSNEKIYYFARLLIFANSYCFAQLIQVIKQHINIIFMRLSVIHYNINQNWPDIGIFGKYTTSTQIVLQNIIIIVLKIILCKYLADNLHEFEIYGPGETNEVLSKKKYCLMFTIVIKTLFREHFYNYIIFFFIQLE